MRGLVGFGAGTGAGVGAGAGGWDLLDNNLGEPDESVESGASESEPVMEICVDDLFKGVNNFPEGFPVV